MPQILRRAAVGCLAVTSVWLGASVVVSSSTAQAAELHVGESSLAGATVPDGSTVRLSAPGAVSVAWVLDGVYAGRDVEAPFELVLGTTPGQHKVKARSETRSGVKTTYEVRFTTVAASPAATQAPSGPVRSSGTPTEAPAGQSATARPAPSSVPTTPAPATVPQRPAPSGGPDDQTSGSPATVDGGASTPAVTGGAVVRVGTTAELQKALSSAVPGHVIALADGVYRGRFVIDRPGAEGAPVVLQGGPGAVLDGGAVDSGNALHLKAADHWRLEGFTVRGGQKGLVLDEADHVVVSGLDVGHTGMEAVHFRSSSSDNRLEASSVHDTGLVEPGFGEGVYIGSATSNWSKYGERGGPDRSDRNVVTGNHVYAVTAENVDVKEGTTGGVISGNSFDGAGMTGDHYADSWIDLKGNDYLVADNKGTRTLLDGFQTHVQLPGWGTGNVFRGNRLDVSAKGVGVNIHRADVSSRNVVHCDNVAIGAGGGLANIPCSG